MNEFKFTSTHFAVSENGIHLLRNGFNFETVDFHEMDSLQIGRGKIINNWLLDLIFGLVLFVTGAYVLYCVLYEYFIGTTIHTFYDVQFLFPIFPLIVGTYLIYLSLKKGLILKISSPKKVKTIAIEKLNDDLDIQDLIQYFYSHQPTKGKFRNELN